MSLFLFLINRYVRRVKRKNNTPPLVSTTMDDLQTAVVWSIVKHAVVVYTPHLDAKAHFEKTQKGFV